MKAWLKRYQMEIWYALCFLMLGWIDQRRGSAVGEVQMIFANLTGPVVVLLLFPSLKKEFFRWRGFFLWLGASAVLGTAACVIGDNYWRYTGQWYTVVLNIALIAGLLLYLVWNRRSLAEGKRLNRTCFFLVMLLLVLMTVSVHESFWPLWFLGLFGAFYLIGIPDGKERSFLLGMLWGFILWFFIQQTVAFGFRPYDYVRYRGMYSGETQNGLFYLMIFCAFLCLWLYLTEKKVSGWKRVLCFLLAGGCVSFIFLTGGRSALTGAFAAGAVGLVGYDILFRKSFRHWLPRGAALLACVVVLLPVVYGCVRYLPVILHHPIWFEGEYNPDTSVHSYDPWNSERYITFEQVIDNNVGRALQMLGIDLNMAEGGVRLPTPLTLQARAAESTQPGSSPENPFMLEGTDTKSSISIRKTIYAYYASHLNWTGHTSQESGFYMTEKHFYGHAHNMFLQFAYDYGILAGAVFLIWNVYCLLRLLNRRDMTGLCCAVFLMAIFLFGFTEMTVVPGQITLVLLFILYYFGMQKKR